MRLEDGSGDLYLDIERVRSLKAKEIVTFTLPKWEDSTMESDISYRFISDRILRKLKETLQAQSSLPQNDLSIQLSCMQASASTLLEVKNILDGIDKKTLKNVADNLASSDGHFVLQRYLISSYYFVQTDGMAAISAEAEVNRPSGVLIFCPLYVAVTEVLTHLLASQTFASNLASTKILQLLLQDLNVLVLPSPKPDQFKMLLANIHFLWEMSKIPAISAHFQNFSDTVLILINVFVSYQGPFEQLTTLVKSITMFIAAEVADDETSVYLLAEDSCLDFIVDILTKSVSTGEQYLNYQGVYAVDIAKCIKNLSQFEGLQEVLLGKGVAELLVSMIQIGDSFDDSAAANALNRLIQTYGIVDTPVLFQGLASYYCDYNSSDSTKHKEVVVSQNSLSTDTQQIPPINNDRFKEEERSEEGEVTKTASLDKNKTTPDNKEELEMSLKVLPQSAEFEGNTMNKNDQGKLNVEEKESLAEVQDRRKHSQAEVDKNINTVDNMEEFSLEMPQHYEVDIKENTVVKTDVSGSDIETVIDTEIVKAEINLVIDETLTTKKAEPMALSEQDLEANTVDKTDVSGSDNKTVVDMEIVTAEINPVTDETTSREREPTASPQQDIKEKTVDKTDVSGSDMETVVDTEEINSVTDTDESSTTKGEPKASCWESRECDLKGDQKKKEMGTEGLNLEGDLQENVVKNISVKAPCHDRNGKQICEQDTEVLCKEEMPQPTTTMLTMDVRETGEKPNEKLSSQVPFEATNQTHNADQTLYQQEDISSYLREQLESMGGEGIKYITIPTQFQPDLIKQPEPKSKQPCPQRPFQYQQSGTDPASGQDLHDIHLSLIDLGVHNMYDEKLVGLLNQILEETKLKKDGIFDILHNVPSIYSYKMLRTGSMQRQLRVVPAHNKEGVNAPLIHVQPEIDYHLVLKKFVFQMVPDHGSKMDFPGFTLIGPWFEKIPEELEEWSFCFAPCKSAEGKMQYYLSADRLKTNFLYPILVSFVHMNMLYQCLMAKGESLEEKDLKHHGITVRKIEENGPAVTVYYFYKYLTVDYVLSLRQIRWPSCAAEWQDRQRHWPDSHTVKDVVDYGCHLVPKQPTSLCEENPLYGLFFQYSFARAENVLLNKLNDDNPVLTDCLRMLKFLCEMHFDRPHLLKSYHMQTIVLLAAERLPPLHWKADSFVKHLLDLLDDLLHFLVAQNLPNYFIPQQNLFQQFSPDFILDVAERVSKVRRNPIKYLTPSGNPARFGIYLI